MNQYDTANKYRNIPVIDKIVSITKAIVCEPRINSKVIIFH